MNVMAKGFQVLVVSQFTLYCVLKGNKPDFHNAMNGEAARELYELFLRKTHEDYKLIKYKNIVKKDLTDPIPKNIPKCDSPVFVETKDCFIEYQTTLDHEHEWNDIVNFI